MSRPERGRVAAVKLEPERLRLGRFFDSRLPSREGFVVEEEVVGTIAHRFDNRGGDSAAAVNDEGPVALREPHAELGPEGFVQNGDREKADPVDSRGIEGGDGIRGDVLGGKLEPIEHFRRGLAGEEEKT